VPSRIAWTDTKLRHRSMMYASSPTLAREQGHRGCRKIRREGRRPSGWMPLPAGQRTGGAPGSPGRAAYASRRRIPETTTTPQAASRPSKRYLTRDVEITSRLSIESIQSGAPDASPEVLTSGTDSLPHREAIPIPVRYPKKHRTRPVPTEIDPRCCARCECRARRAGDARCVVATGYAASIGLTQLTFSGRVSCAK